MEANYKKLNYRRIAVIRDDLIDWLHKLDVSYKKMTVAVEEDDIIVGTGSFRSYLVNYRELVFSAVSHLCKTLMISISSNRVLYLFQSCVDAGYFTVTDMKFFKILNSYRISASHRYEQPTIPELIEFYNNYRDCMEQLVDDLNNILSHRPPRNPVKDPDEFNHFKHN